jgi:alpha-galactosidase
MDQVAVKQEWTLALKPDGMELSHPPDTGQQLASGVCLELRIEVSAHEITVFPLLSNRGGEAVPVGDVELPGLKTDLPTAFSRAFVNGRNMVENTGLVALDEDILSNSVLGLTDANGTQAFAVGAIRPDDAWYDFSLSAGGENSRRLKMICRLENTLLAPGASRILSPVRLYSGSSLARLMGRYADDVAEQMVPASHFKDPPSGWCSWYHYYGTDDVDDIRKNMQAIQASPLNGRLQVIQIDDGWNRSRNAARNWGDWLPDGKYPAGMKALADEIHTNGFQAGLWLAPFSVDAASQLYQDHPDWLVQASGAEGELDPLAAPGGVFGLDLTRPEVQQFVRETFRRVFTDWKFDYIKIDFISHGAIEGRRADRTKTGIEAFRIGMKIIREEAGPDKFILNCGSPITASVGLCDGMRIGMDVGGRWFAPMNLKEWRHGNCCIKAAANSTLWRQWMHGIWWHNDPDCIVLRRKPVAEELKKFIRNPLQDRLIHAEEFGLTEEESGCWLRLVWMSGGMLILSENAAEIAADQWHRLKQMDKPNTQPVCWIDDYQDPELGMLRTVTGPLMVGLFNLSDQTADVSLEAGKLGISNDWKFCEWMGLETFSGTGETICFPQVPPHAGRIWMLQFGARS